MSQSSPSHPKGQGSSTATSRPVEVFAMVRKWVASYWVAVKELKLSYYIGETLLYLL